MFTITRRTLHQFRIVARKALNIYRGVGPPIVVEPADDGLCLQICSEEAAVELRLPGNLQGERICVPFELLDDCQAKNDEPVTLALEDGKVAAQWQDGNVPQLHQYDQPEPSLPMHARRAGRGRCRGGDRSTCRCGWTMWSFSLPISDDISHGTHKSSPESCDADTRSRKSSRFSLNPTHQDAGDRC